MPADGEFVDGLLTEVVVSFSAEAEPVGDGFQVVSATGLTVVPQQASSVDGKSWRLAFDQPVGAGTIGVRWLVQAPDAHPIEGSFSFVVAPSAQVTSGASAAVEPEPSGTTVTTLGVGDDVELGLVDEDAVSTQALREFLEVDDRGPSGAGQARLVGRFLGIGGTVLAIGSLMFVGTVLGANDPERRLAVGWVAVFGLVVAAGTVLESVGGAAMASGVWFGSPLVGDVDLASVLRGAGGASSAIGAVLLYRRLGTVGSQQPAMKLVAAGGPPVSSTASQKSRSDDGSFVRLMNVPLLVGFAGIVFSFVFDGHTATEGDRLLTGVASLSHVLAGGVWAGGVVALGGLLWLRHRQKRPLDALRLGTRFSVVAAVAVGFAGLTGIVLSVTILDSAGGLWSTPWGRVLLAKSALVAVAVCLGAYNHYSVIPALVHDSGSGRFRRTIRTEVLILLAVVVLTAFLVAADST